MTPINEIVPGFNIPFTVFGPSHPGYTPLPAIVEPSGMVTSRWRLSVTERLKILFYGDLWLSVETLGKPPQPVSLEVSCPLMGHYMGDEEV